MEEFTAFMRLAGCALTQLSGEGGSGSEGGGQGDGGGGRRKGLMLWHGQWHASPPGQIMSSQVASRHVAHLIEWIAG